ncbi:hypothetical protein DL762_001026 [Monosporascus cannonballus]|uniref:Uncharacterized protein n=1 Tax=Monosporascus cannonballus TaxID=155416 RepID=A0ABY0HI41_9PEZI|nr:hypothetical protein DL762_001026 [Monosporascus cannonballus]RYP00096.1 hypothetical protein DL763_001025 [Monosporascus cannonballus]
MRMPRPGLVFRNWDISVGTSQIPEHHDIVAGLRAYRVVIEGHEDGNLGSSGFQESLDLLPQIRRRNWRESGKRRLQA